MEAAAILALAFFLDLILGDPPYRFHPIRLMGRLIVLAEDWLRSRDMDGRTGGLFMVLGLSFTVTVVCLGIYLLFHWIWRIAGLGVALFFCYSSLALKDLVHHVQPVIFALRRNDIESARKFVSMIVGRDVEYLGEVELARASIETLAENFVDGFLSPVFWFFIGAWTACLFDCQPLPAAVVFMLLFKLVSTLDSMVGYQTPRYKKLGWASARLDDIMNFVPARLSLPILFGGACLSGIHPWDGLAVAMRDRLRHSSPNSAYPESFFAGALHCRLGGPVSYKGELHEYEWLGREYHDPYVKKIIMAIRMTIVSSWITIGMVIWGLVFLN